MTITLHVLAGDVSTAASHPGATAAMPRQQTAQDRPLHCLSPAARTYRHLTFQPMQQDGRALGHLLYNNAAGNDDRQDDASQKPRATVACRPWPIRCRHRQSRSRAPSSATSRCKVIS